MVRLLLAEDDRDLRDLLCTILEANGEAEVIAVGNGRDALNHLLSDDGFHAAVLDVRMPLMSGLEVLREAKKARTATPIVLITSFADAELRRRALALGAACVIDKPLDGDYLRRVVDAIAGLRTPPA